MGKFFTLFVASFVLLAILPNSNKAACCYSDIVRKCKDGSVGTPYCGCGPCNFFGCSCEGGCRHKNESSNKVEDIFENAKLSKEEAFEKALINFNYQAAKEFEERDENEDGFLDNYELNRQK